MANKIYAAPETAITFQDSGGTVVLSLQNLAFGAGRISARRDRGAGSQPVVYEWRAVIQFETAPALDEVVEIYLSTSDGTYADGTIGTADAALTSDKRKNLKLLGLVRADTTSVTTDIVASGIVEIYSRYFSIGVWNGSAADNLENTANASKIILTPYPPEIQ